MNCQFGVQFHEVKCVKSLLMYFLSAANSSTDGFASLFVCLSIRLPRSRHSRPKHTSMLVPNFTKRGYFYQWEARIRETKEKGGHFFAQVHDFFYLFF